MRGERPLPDYLVDAERQRIEYLRVHNQLTEAQRAQEFLEMRMAGRNGNGLNRESHPRHPVHTRKPKITSNP